MRAGIAGEGIGQRRHDGAARVAQESHRLAAGDVAAEDRDERKRTAAVLRRAAHRELHGQPARAGHAHPAHLVAAVHERLALHHRRERRAALEKARHRVAEEIRHGARSDGTQEERAEQGPARAVSRQGVQLVALEFDRSIVNV
jgi:hypothetical protein